MKQIYCLLLCCGLTFLSPLHAQNTVKPIQELMSGIKSPQDVDAAKAYVRDTLLFDQLHHSGLWKEYIQNWVAFFMYTTNGEAQFTEQFVPDATTVLARTIPQNKQVAQQLATDLIDFFEQYGLDNASGKIALFAVNSGLHSEKIDKLAVAAKLVGKPAPAIKGADNLKNAIMIFYESGCDNCDEQLKALKEIHAQIQAKGYQVISVSSDEDKVVFDFHAKTFPWKYKICDYKGLEGGNFLTYGVVGTPTLYLTDANGIILGKYARLQNVLDAIAALPAK